MENDNLLLHIFHFQTYLDAPYMYWTKHDSIWAIFPYSRLVSDMTLKIESSVIYVAW